jgi:hypothetical protein
MKSKSKSPKKNNDNIISLKIHTENEENMNQLSKILKIELIPETKSHRKANNIGFDLKCVPDFDCNVTKNFCSTEIEVNPQILKKIQNLGLEIKKSSTDYIWYPKRPENNFENKMYITTETVNPQYPVYIISKGRYESRLTSIALEKMNVPYKIVVEPQEFDLYAKYIDPKKILILPNKYLNKNQASIPARNFCWEHSIKNGATHHWILDDNIRRFFRLHKNAKIEVRSGVCFRVIEDMIKQFKNVGMAGMQYSFFIPEKRSWPIAVRNTRIYSCILINNSVKHRWRGTYNEDTDLSLRVLKDGMTTFLFNNFLCDKQATLNMKGGNTDSIYNVKNGLVKKAESLVEQHPDVVKMTTRFGRPHHLVNYRPFLNNPLIKNNPVKCKMPKEYYMKLVPKIYSKEIKKVNKMFDDKISIREIADKYNVNISDVRKIRKRSL